MSEMLRSLKADLSSRRMLPLLILAGLALLGAAGYALAGGSGSTPTPPPAAVMPAPVVEGPSVSAAPANANAALAETTSGGSVQHGGPMRNPFAPLPGGEAAAGSSGGSTGSTSTITGSNGSGSGGAGSSGSGGAGSSGSGGAGSGGSGSGGSGGEGSGAGEAGSPSPASTIYKVSVKLQKLDESGEPEGKPQSFADVARLAPLPSSRRALLALDGVSRNGDAVFVLLAPAILHGSASCLPSPANCEAIDLKAGRSEELQYLLSGGQVVAYSLKVSSVTKASASAAAAEVAHRRVSKAGSELIAGMRLSMPKGIRFAPELGVLLGVGKALAQSAESSLRSASEGAQGARGSRSQGGGSALAQGSKGSPE